MRAAATPGQGWVTTTFDDLLRAAPPTTPVLRRPAGDQLAVIAFTSGSTGLPKGSKLSHGAMMSAIFEAVLQEPSMLRCRALDVTSLAYLGGLLNSFLGPLVLGGSTVLLPSWDSSEALRLISDEGVTLIACTTIFYEQMANDASFDHTDLGSLTVTIAGGSPVRVALLARWHARHVSIRQGYGLTEGCSLVTLPPSEVATARPELAGLGGILRDVRIVDDDDNEVPAGTPGQIVIRGPGIAAGYWDDPKTTADEFANGFLHTGDIGTIDESGGLQVVGRTKDVIISGGINIYAAELERVIGEVDGVLEVAVIGVADDQYGETPAALVVASRQLDPAEIVTHCRERLASYKAPRYVEFIDGKLPAHPSARSPSPSCGSATATFPAVPTASARGTADRSQRSRAGRDLGGDRPGTETILTQKRITSASVTRQEAVDAPAEVGDRSRVVGAGDGQPGTGPLGERRRAAQAQLEVDEDLVPREVGGRMPGRRAPALDRLLPAAEAVESGHPEIDRVDLVEHQPPGQIDERAAPETISQSRTPVTSVPTNSMLAIRASPHANPTERSAGPIPPTHDSNGSSSLTSHDAAIHSNDARQYATSCSRPPEGGPSPRKSIPAMSTTWSAHSASIACSQTARRNAR